MGDLIVWETATGLLGICVMGKCSALLAVMGWYRIHTREEIKLPF